MENPFSLEDIHGMTPEKLRKYPGLKDLTDGEADKAIFTLYQLLNVFYESNQTEDIDMVGK